MRAFFGKVYQCGSGNKLIPCSIACHLPGKVGTADADGLREEQITDKSAVCQSDSKSRDILVVNLDCPHQHLIVGVAYWLTARKGGLLRGWNHLVRHKRLSLSLAKPCGLPSTLFLDPPVYQMH